MCATWRTSKEGYNRDLPELLAERLEGARVEEGFQGFEHQEYVAVLQSIVAFASPVPDAVKRGLVYSSTFNAAQAGTTTANSLIRELSKLEAEYQGQAEKQFVLATSISVKPTELLDRTSMRGRSITFSRYLPTEFEPLRVRELASEYVTVKLPRQYLITRVSVEAKSEIEAFEVGLDTLNLLRGIWNLFLNRRTLTRSSTGRRQPVNRVLLGPAHTLHTPSGNLTSDSALWYEDDYVGPVSGQNLDKYWEALKAFENKVRAALANHKNHNYQEDVEDTILRYTRALDNRSWNAAFVDLWGLLETLTWTLKDSYDVTVKRALFLQRDRRYQKQVLTHLRNNRNKAVHAGQEAAEIETLLYQTKRYVEWLLLFHIFNLYQLSSIEDAAEFLDLPPDVPELERGIRRLEERVQLMKKAIQFDSL